jgi:hypothetical protein
VDAVGDLFGIADEGLIGRPTELRHRVALGFW